TRTVTKTATMVPRYWSKVSRMSVRLKSRSLPSVSWAERGEGFIMSLVVCHRPQERGCRDNVVDYTAETRHTGRINVDDVTRFQIEAIRQYQRIGALRVQVPDLGAAALTFTNDVTLARV